MGGIDALDSNYDARKFTICAPNYGERHPRFRLWQQAFLAGVADEVDDDAGLDETLLGTEAAAATPWDPHDRAPCQWVLAGRRYFRT